MAVTRGDPRLRGMGSSHVRLEAIRDLKTAESQAVIINAGTKLATTLALLSALRYAGMPVLLIDCESKDGSLEHFSSMMERHEFDLLSAPLRTHGATLDWLFGVMPAEKLLLVDSDTEILNPNILSWMNDFIDDDRTFGCGFVNGPFWLKDQTGILDGAYYQERPYMPLTMLKVRHVREALQHSQSFEARIIYNDFSPSSRISRRIANLRFRHPRLKRWLPSWKRWMNMFMNTYNGHRPSVVYADTGAEVYQYLKYHRGYTYAGLPDQFCVRYMDHFFGVTRAALAGEATHGQGASMQETAARIRRRLRDVYDFSLPDEAPARLTASR
jgi:hypothetical protein